MSAHLPITALAAAWIVFLCHLMGLGLHAFAAACLIVWLIERGDEVARGAAERERDRRNKNRMRRRK